MIEKITEFSELKWFVFVLTVAAIIFIPIIVFANEQLESENIYDKIIKVYAVECIKEGRSMGDDHIRCIEDKIDEEFKVKA